MKVRALVVSTILAASNVSASLAEESAVCRACRQEQAAHALTQASIWGGGGGLALSFSGPGVTMGIIAGWTAGLLSTTVSDRHNCDAACNTGSSWFGSTWLSATPHPPWESDAPTIAGKTVNVPPLRPRDDPGNSNNPSNTPPPLPTEEPPPTPTTNPTTPPTPTPTPPPTGASAAGCPPDQLQYLQNSQGYTVACNGPYTNGEWVVIYQGPTPPPGWERGINRSPYTPEPPQNTGVSASNNPPPCAHPDIMFAPRSCDPHPVLPAWASTSASTMTVSGGPCGIGWVDSNGVTLDQLSIKQNPSHGSIQLKGKGSLTYTPAPGYKGSDSFSVSIQEHYRDGRRATAGSNVSVTIK
jgi:hypothetical protein